MDSNPSRMEHRLIYATHNADHVELNPAQRMAVQHLREQLGRLLRRRDAFASLIRSTSEAPMGLSKQPNAEQQDSAYELTQGFFEQYYAALSALASVHGRIRLYLSHKEAPINSNDKFLDWWEVVGQNTRLDDRMDALRAARDFRSIFMHPQMWSIFDWATVSSRDEIRVVLHGAESSNRNVPQGASRVGSSANWEFVAPDMDEVLEGFELLCQATFLPIFTWYPEAESASPCVWEPDGVGSSIGDGAARVIRNALVADGVASGASARLALRLIEDLDKYIGSMAEIRKRAGATPVASAYPSGIPAARPSLSPRPPFAD
ncbi:hypothetical protein HOW07_10310 [Plantibacter sp. MCCC 1A11337]|uniref:hypothetical protein n=1 Tax=Plantibacter sp. MCCC 1A11337 TaxID=2736644 RepID=UPI001581AEF5|nr:hypothetical protein [Plantibacter sp. MCCC 1A11337]NUJ88401.1 hypothetical protein [Plantibacter sp. MCCC 1A11337]